MQNLTVCKQFIGINFHYKTLKLMRPNSKYLLNHIVPPHYKTQNHAQYNFFLLFKLKRVVQVL